MLTYTLGEILRGYTPKPVPTNGDVLCECKKGVVKPHDELCIECQENAEELMQAIQDMK